MLSNVVTVAKIAVLAWLALLASGCSTVAFASVFHQDGSATHSITVMFERGGLVEQDARRLDRQIESAIRRAEADGYTSERINTMTQTGMRISTTTRETLDTGAVLNGLYNSLARESSGPIAPFVGGFERESTAVGGTRFNFNLSVDGDLLFRSVQDVSPGHRQLATRDGVNEVVHFMYSVTMPGRVQSENGEVVGQSMVRWHVPLEDTTMMTATSNQSKDSPWILITITILGSITLVVLIAAAIAWILLHRRSRGHAAIVSPAAGASTTLSQSVAPDPSITVQDVGSSLARVVDHVLGVPVDQPDPVDANDERAVHREVADGSQP